MNTSPTRRLLVALSLTLAFAGCGERAAENAGKQIDQATGKVSEKIDEAAGKAAQKVDQVVSTVKQEATVAGREVGKVGEAITDTGITAQVKAAIIAYPGLKSLSINVDTINGVVFLSGFVDSPADRQRSGEIAAAVSGVRSVDNNLRLGRPPVSRAAAGGDGNAMSY